MRDIQEPAPPPAAAAPLGPWQLAWLLLLPLALWVFVAKAALIMHALYPVPRTGDGLVALFKWFWAFTSLRLLAGLLGALAVQRLLWPRQRWAVLPLAACLLGALALLVAVLKPGQSAGLLLQVWAGTAFGQLWGLAVCLWRDAVSLAILVLGFGLLLRCTPAAGRRGVLLLLQLAVVLLSGMVGIYLAYELGTGQPVTLRVLLFVLGHWRDLLPLIASETTPFRAVAIAGGFLLPLVWAWRHRRLAARPLQGGRRDGAVALRALTLSLAVFLPRPLVDIVPMLRYTEGTLITLAQAGSPALVQAVKAELAPAHGQTQQPRWHGADMQLRETAHTRRRNVVIVMLESVRAKSTTLHEPRLPTMPVLQQLANEGLMIEDMTAVIPRTTAAWIALLAGQYPLANEGIGNWVAASDGAPRIRSLPSMLRDAGYATSFFTPTYLTFQNDVAVVDALGFEVVRTERDLAPPGTERVTYFGVADELMVKPILDWTAAQAEAKRPFFTAIMTNVGHHDFRTPPGWQKMPFDGVHDPALASYYNCLRYIDGVLASLMDGYRRLGVLDETIFVIVGDHGQMFNEHNARQTYDALYQEGLHVPAVIFAPGMGLPPGRVHGPRQQIDVLPTIVELLGFQLEGAALPGLSLLAPVPARRTLHYASSIDWSFLSLRRGSRKYIYSFDRRPMEVFDLATDPGEMAPLKDVDADELTQAAREMIAWRLQAEHALRTPARGAMQGPFVPAD